MRDQETTNRRLEKERTELSIVIPLYNEAACLSTNLATISSYLETLPISSEIILINDGSHDNTDDIGRRIAVQNPHVRMESYTDNRGKGYAVRTGMLMAEGRWVIFMDADLAVPLEFTGHCIDHLKRGAPIVIGSRHLPGSCFKIPEGILRTVMGKIYRKITLLGLGLKVTDITCGLKGFSKQAALDVFSRSVINRWGYDAEILFLSQRLGYAITEIPVEWYHSFNSTVRIGRDSVGTFLEMIRIVINDRKKRYDIS